MNIEEIKAAATNVLEHHDDYGGHEIALARALLVALLVVEAAQTVSRKAIVILDFHEQGTTVELDLMREALADFDKAIEGMKP